MKKSKLFLFAWILLSQIALAQIQKPPTTADLLKEINQDIWLPFAEAYQTGNAEKYLSLHSVDFIRGVGDAKQLLNLGQYSVGVKKSFATWQERKNKISIQFRFLERIINSESASERGIYKFSSVNERGEVQKFYGKFHVFARKEKGIWKILVDYDSNENQTIDETAYQAASAIDDFSKF